jgi:hypothetical protein
MGPTSHELEPSKLSQNKNFSLSVDYLRYFGVIDTVSVEKTASRKDQGEHTISTLPQWNYKTRFHVPTSPPESIPSVDYVCLHRCLSILWVSGLLRSGSMTAIMLRA